MELGRKLLSLWVSGRRAATLSVGSPVAPLRSSPPSAWIASANRETELRTYCRPML